MEELCASARGLKSAAETLFLAITFQAAAMMLAMGLMLTFS